MAVGGVAVRVTAEALRSGSVRLKHSTAEQFLGPEILLDSTGVGTDIPKALVLNPWPAQWYSSPVDAQLRRVPGAARPSQALNTPGTSPPPPPSLHCELCGLGAWLRGQGAVPGMHWVQLWRGAGGALRLRLCDGKPTALPGEEAEAAAEQQVVAVAPTAPSKDVGALIPAAAGAHAAAMIVGPAAQAVADAAAPWQLQAPAWRAPCVPSRPAMRIPANGGHSVPWSTTQGSGSSGGSGPVTSGGAGRDAAGAGSHGLMDAAPSHPHRDGDMGGASHWLSLPPMPPPPLLLEPDPQLSPLSSPSPPPPEVPAQRAPHPAARAEAPAAAGACGPPGYQTTGAFGSAAQGQLQQRQQQQHQQQPRRQGGGGVPGRPPGTGILTGRVSNHKICLRTAEAQGLLAPSLLQGRGLQSGADWITVHVDEINSRHEEAQRGQQQGSEFTVRLICYQQSGRQTKCSLSSAGALLRALGAVGEDTVQLQYKLDGRLVAWRAVPQLHQRQQAAAAVRLAACPADSTLVGYKYGPRLVARMGAVRALWPEIACQLACGQSTEVEVHVAVADAGGEEVGPFTLTLKLHRYMSRSPYWRLSGCGPLFRALGAQDGDAIYMWSSLEDGRVLAGLQPRGGVRRDGEEVRLRQQQGQEQGAEYQQVQGRQGDERRQQPLRRARQGGLRRLYGDYVVQEPAGGEGGDEEETDYTEEGVEELEIGDAGQGERSSGGLSARQRQRVQRNAFPAGSIFVGYMDRTKVDVRAAAVHALWHEAASQLACGQSTEVEVHAAVADAGAQALGPFTAMLKLNTWPSRPAVWRLTGCGPLFRDLGAQDGDAIFMWRSPGDGRLMAGVQRVRKHREGERLGQQQRQELEAGWQEEQCGGRCGQLQGRVTQGALHRLYGKDVLQEPLDRRDGEGEEGAESGESAGEWEIGMSDQEGQGGFSSGLPDAGLSRPSKRARAVEGAAQQHGGPSAAQQQQLLSPCPTGSVLIGYRYHNRADIRAAAVHTLWPDIACQRACGQSAEVDVHPATVGAAVGVQVGGGEAPGSFRVVLQLYTWPSRSPLWRLTGCGPLFRAMGAQHGDAIHMWRSPGDGRLMAGVQPRGEVHGASPPVQAGGQRVAGPRRAGGKVRQVYDEYDMQETTDEEDLWLSEDENEHYGGHGEEEVGWQQEGEVASADNGEADFGALLEGRAGQGCGARDGGGVWGWEGAQLRSGGDNETGVGGEEEGEEEEGEEEEEDDLGVNCWAREVRGEFGFGEEGDGGEQDEEQV